MSSGTIQIATRGSALALAQSTMIRDLCRQRFPDKAFELKIIKTTGDKLQTINLTNPNQESTKGLFTKELEVALLDGTADFAVHSLKDLPTELPPGLKLGAVTEREDPRDVLIYRRTERNGCRAFPPGTGLADLPPGAAVATGSTRRQAQILALRPDLKTVPIRGNVGTRLKKLLDQPELDAIILAMAGLNRLSVQFGSVGELTGPQIPEGCLSVPLSIEEMIPCVGQAALGIETRSSDPGMDEICAVLNHPATWACATAERAFLAALGGGCLSPVAAYAEARAGELHLRAISFRNETLRRVEKKGRSDAALELGRAAADALSY